LRKLSHFENILVNYVEICPAAVGIIFIVLKSSENCLDHWALSFLYEIDKYQILIFVKRIINNKNLILFAT